MSKPERSFLTRGYLPSAFSLFFIFSVVHAADPSEDLFDLDDLRVKIRDDMPYVVVKHGEEDVIIMRRQDVSATIDPPFDSTARDCPPFCVQPMSLHPGVETIGELELIEYLQRVSAGDRDVLIIDSRTKAYTQFGTIPGAVNIPFTELDPLYTPESEIVDTLELEFNAFIGDELWDFRHARTLVFFCNGPWCGQSPTNIKVLLRLGYPPGKLKWYRGGIQAWEQFGLTTVRDGEWR